jgi:hypothetical protein
MKVKMAFQTKDFYLAASILASNIQLLELIPINHKSFSFVFNTSPINAEKIIESYWQRELILPIRDYVDALHELKTRIYSEKSNYVAG